MIETTWINGKTRDYLTIKGIIQKKNPLLTESYSRIVTPLNSYWFDPSFGSQIPLWLNRRALLDSNTVVTELLRCTAPITNENRAQLITAKLTAPITKNAIFFLLEITDNNGIVIELDNNYVSIPNS